MRFSPILIIATLASFSIAAPVKRGFFDNIKTEVGNLINSNATLAGVAKTIGQSIANPKLTAARIEVIKGLSDTTNALNQINTQAQATNNAGVSTLVSTAQAGVSQAHTAVNNIGEALVSGGKGSPTDQKNVAVGIKAALEAVNQMSAAITTPDATLSSNIASAQTSVANLEQGGLGVISAEGVTLADLGLPDDFATSP